MKTRINAKGKLNAKGTKAVDARGKGQVASAQGKGTPAHKHHTTGPVDPARRAAALKAWETIRTNRAAKAKGK
jgi:hypothetical protein